MSAKATARSVSHGTFVIEREFPYPPARVFAAWADPQAKAKWFAGPTDKWKMLQRDMDFRVGGRERLRGKFIDGWISDFDAHYLDIEPDRRIVYSYVMHVDDKKLSVSLATIEFEPAGREQGTRALVDNLEKELRHG